VTIAEPGGFHDMHWARRVSPSDGVLPPAMDESDRAT
jgi:hypothetical protein